MNICEYQHEYLSIVTTASERQKDFSIQHFAVSLICWNVVAENLRTSELNGIMKGAVVSFGNLCVLSNQNSFEILDPPPRF